jgi:NAD+ synthase
LRAEHYDAHFVAIRLPYGEQKDEADAQQALRFIRADENLAIDIKPAADAMLAALDKSGVLYKDESQQDFVHGNIKARQRMIAQYAVAGARAGVVIGTDHAAESVMGFFTKFGDGGADVLPLAGLNKRRVRAVAKALGAPEALAHKVPTADLEMLRPQRPDEDAYGIPYDAIDDFLERKPVSDAARAIILRFYEVTRHKRALPYTPFDWPVQASGD